MPLDADNGRIVRTLHGLNDLIGCCQTNANQSPKSPTLPSSCRQLTPLGQRDGAVLLEDGAAVEMAVEIEVVEGRSMNGGEFLQGLYAPDFRHRPFLSSKRLM